MKVNKYPGLVELANEVSGERLMEYTDVISKEVRLSGSEEELRAFHYIQQNLEGFGLQTQLVFQDAYVSLPLEAEIRIAGVSVACITHSMAPSTSLGGVEGELIFVENLYGELPNLEKKIVLLQGIALPSSVELIESLGGSGVIFINGPLTHEMIVSTVWGNPTPKDVYPTIPVLSVDNGAGAILKNRTGQSCWVRTRVDTAWRKIPCLTAEINGQVEGDSFLLFSGHVDSWHYGAMDNATANATMLEVARILSKYQNALRRTVRFAFWSGHSHGRYAGSTEYCDTHWEEIHDHCFLHVYVDSVGGKGASILGESNCMEETKNLASEVLALFTEETYIGKRFARAGDQSFWGAGVPSLYMGMSEQPLSNDPASQALFQLFGGKRAGGFGWWWHTTEDTLDKIDKDHLVRDCKIYLASIYEACTSVMVPIDQRGAIKAIQEAVTHYQETGGDAVDLKQTLVLISALSREIEKLYEKLNSSVYENVVDVNNGIMRISKLLVPLQYVEGDPFNHDKANYLAPVPLLSPIHELVKAEENSSEYFQWRTIAKRRINKLNNVLGQANKVVIEMNEMLG